MTAINPSTSFIPNSLQCDVIVVHRSGGGSDSHIRTLLTSRQMYVFPNSSHSCHYRRYRTYRVSQRVLYPFDLMSTNNDVNSKCTQLKEQLTAFVQAPLTSCDAERSFSRYKAML
ncbi:hypothetical protein ANN_10073 [Periplaneta americana]|uniref:HAT C-terminal dimerisation domain-containing protein n=1 Tax=Periplaneta americana TaxID=6978 RepID=A0ABQ8TN17_PERAM|nr:hypothetical protein ANN_10073 [Periplaneta americana]